MESCNHERINRPTLTSTPAVTLPCPVIILGRDDNGRPHASFFPPTDIHLNRAWRITVQGPQAPSTTPFAQPSGGVAGTGQQVPANRNVMLQNPPPKSAAATTASTSAWTFGQREEDLGDTCFVEVRHGDVTVGFNQVSG